MTNFFLAVLEEIYKHTDKKQHPGEAEERDESRVQSNKETKSCIIN